MSTLINTTNDFYMVEAIQEKVGNKVRYMIGVPNGVKFFTKNVKGMTPKEKLELLRTLVGRANLVYKQDVHHYGIRLEPYKATQFVIDRRGY